MDKERFIELAQRANVVPVYREVLADRDTPVGLVYKLRDEVRFLLESVEGGERWGRYSILGLEPAGHITLYPGSARVAYEGVMEEFPVEGNPMDFVRNQVARFQPAEVEGLPRFHSGLVGYLAYEIVHFMERMPPLKKEVESLPLAYLMLVKDLIVFDNVRHTMKLVVNAYVDGGSPEEAYDAAVKRIDALTHRIERADGSSKPFRADPPAVEVHPQDEVFKKQVETVKEYIRSGEAIQVVISREFFANLDVPCEDLYRALRYVNPSPYLFLLKTPDLNLIGSSPEVMVRKEGNRVTVRPIAGTRPRGEGETEDRALADDLLNDPKERAEHVMLVDLARNDVGRIAQIGTVQVNQYMTVERYSHVMHLVSNVTGELERDKDCFDVIAATFPAGTLSGAPKVRAMEIIHELETEPRGPYGGAVGYIGFNGEMDLCITIRTLCQKGDRLSWRAGAGIVFDSVPESESQETKAKGGAMGRAVALTSAGLRLGE